MGEPRAESRGSGHQSEKRVSSPAQGKGVLFGWGSNRAPLLPTELPGRPGAAGQGTEPGPADEGWRPQHFGSGLCGFCGQWHTQAGLGPRPRTSCSKGVTL